MSINQIRPSEPPVRTQESHVASFKQAASRKFSAFAKRAAYVATSVEPLEKVAKVTNFSITFLGESGVKLSDATYNLSSQIKSFTDFTDALKLFRSAAEWMNFKAVMQNSWQKIASKLSLLVSGIFATLRWIDRTFNQVLKGISTIQVGRFPLFSSVKDSLVVLASFFMVWENSMQAPRVCSNRSAANDGLSKWKNREQELLGLIDRDAKIGNEVRQRLSQKLADLKVRQAADPSVTERIKLCTKQLQMNDVELAESLSENVAFKLRYWTVKKYNADLVHTRTWLGLANDIAKIFAITCVFVVIGTATTSGPLILLLATLGIIGNSINLRKILFDKFDNIPQKLPQRYTPFNPARMSPA